MMKNFILGALLVSSLSFAQVGINTPNPQATLHVDGAKDNPATGTPTVTQQANDFAVTSAGNVGIGTAAPAEKLDVASGNARIRAINSNVASGAYNIVAADANGVLKVTPTQNFSTGDAGNRVLRATGGSNWVAGVNWQNNNWTALPLDEQYDPMNAYDPTTGVFTVPQDGMYHISAEASLMIGTNGNFITGSGTFNGVGGDFKLAIAIDDTTRVSVNKIKVLRGTSEPNGQNGYANNTSTIVWLKAGQNVRLQIFTFATMNMAANLSDVILSRNSSGFRSLFIITKLL